MIDEHSIDIDNRKANNLLYLFMVIGVIPLLCILAVYYTNPDNLWICPYISRHLLSLNPLLACCRRYSRGER